MSSHLEPFRPDQGREQVDEQESGDGGGDVEHSGTSDPIAGDHEGQAEPHARHAEHEHRRQPDDETHGGRSTQEACQFGHGGFSSLTGAPPARTLKIAAIRPCDMQRGATAKSEHHGRAPDVAG